MCHVQSDELLELEKRPSDSLLDQQCKKCGIEKGIVVLRVNDVYCNLGETTKELYTFLPRGCFLPYFIHKFRSTLGKSKLLKMGDWVLVAHSGGQASSAMLHLIKDALEDGNKKKLKYTSVILYIDEGTVLDQPVSERLGICQQVVDLALSYGFPIYITTLEMVYKVDDGSPQDVVYSVLHDEPVAQLPTDPVLEQRLKDLFSSVTSLTAKEDLLLRLRHQLICKVTEKLGLNKVFLGDSGTRLSVRLLADIAQGRGAQLTEDTGFSHNWGSQVLVLRPMREFVTKEIAVYNNIHNLKNVFVPTLATKADHHASIARLSEQFVHGLQMDFPSTISTVFRTGDKLCANQQQLEQDKCVLCQGLLDVMVRDDSALRATEFSLQHVVMLSKGSMPLPTQQEPESPEEKNVTPANVPKPQSATEPSGDTSVGASVVDATVVCCARNPAVQGEAKECVCVAKSAIRLSREEMIPHLCYGCRVVVRDMKDVNSLPEHVHEEALRRCRRTKMKQEISEYLLEDDD